MESSQHEVKHDIYSRHSEEAWMCGFIPINTVEVGNSCVRQCTVHQPELPGIHCCIVDSFLVLEFHLDCQQDVLKASCRYVSFRYGWHRESVLGGSRNHLLKLLMTFKHTSSHPTDSVRPNLIIHTLWGPHCPLLTLKARRNRTEFCISNLQIIQTSVHMSMHLVWQVLLDSSQEHQVWWPQNLT